MIVVGEYTLPVGRRLAEAWQGGAGDYRKSPEGKEEDGMSHGHSHRALWTLMLWNGRIQDGRDFVKQLTITAGRRAAP